MQKEFKERLYQEKKRQSKGEKEADLEAIFISVRELDDLDAVRVALNQKGDYRKGSGDLAGETIRFYFREGRQNTQIEELISKFENAVERTVNQLRAKREPDFQPSGEELTEGTGEVVEDLGQDVRYRATFPGVGSTSSEPEVKVELTQEWEDREREREKIEFNFFVDAIERLEQVKEDFRAYSEKAEDRLNVRLKQ